MNRGRALLALSRTFCARARQIVQYSYHCKQILSFTLSSIVRYRMIVTEIGIKRFIQDIRTLSANPENNIY